EQTRHLSVAKDHRPVDVTPVDRNRCGCLATLKIDIAIDPSTSSVNTLLVNSYFVVTSENQEPKEIRSNPVFLSHTASSFNSNDSRLSSCARFDQHLFGREEVSIRKRELRVRVSLGMLSFRGSRVRHLGWVSLDANYLTKARMVSARSACHRMDAQVFGPY